MALIKKHVKQDIEDLPKFSNLNEAINYFESSTEHDNKDYAIEEIAKFDGAVEYFVSCIRKDDVDKSFLSKIASVISNMDSKNLPIESIMELLKVENAYVRNLAISILRNFGDAIEYYIVKFLTGEDRDLRIFAINVLGDVDFATSRDMLVELTISIAEGCFFIICLRACKPSITGMFISIVITSYCVLIAFCTASFPFLAVSIS
jgi:hypothetical protein